MATAERVMDASVKESRDQKLLRGNIWSVGFFQAVRLILRGQPNRAAVGQFAGPEKEAVRFSAHPSIAFPASEIQQLEMPSDDSQPARMTVNFMGLSGPVGALPTPYTELILEREQKKDRGLREFLDLFNHRMISLFYRAWEKYRFVVRYERGDPDTLTPVLKCLVGVGIKDLSDRQEVDDESLLFYTGLLSRRPRSAQGLRQLLSDYFNVPVQVEQFAGRWVRVREHDQTRLAEREADRQALGRGALVGDEVWDTQSTVRIRLGPLSLAQYVGFLPRPEAKAYRELKALLRFYANDEVDFELQLVLKREETPACELPGSPGEFAPMLGWTTWVKNRPVTRDPEESVLRL
jgi:type VI secretion system protein ImpH